MVRRGHRARRAQARRGGRHPRTDDARRTAAISASSTAGARSACSRCCSPATACRRRGGRGSTSISALPDRRQRPARGAVHRLAAGALRPRHVAALLRLLPERDPHPALYETLAVLVDHLDDAGPRAGPLRAVRARDARRARLRPRSRRVRRDGRRRDDSSTCRRKAGGRSAPSAGEPYKDRLLALPALPDRPDPRANRPRRDDISGRLRA